MKVDVFYLIQKEEKNRKKGGIPWLLVDLVLISNYHDPRENLEKIQYYDIVIDIANTTELAISITMYQ